MPTTIGVPTAPKLTGVDWMMRPARTAAIAGKPRASKSGATTAAGVPKPAAPSMKEPKSQAMMMTCTRRSGEIAMNPERIVSIAPDRVTVASSRSAPKTIHSSPIATRRPWTTDAPIVTHSICQAKFATSAAAISPIGMAYFAGQRKPMRRIPAKRMGERAKRAATARLSTFQSDPRRRCRLGESTRNVLLILSGPLGGVNEHTVSNTG